MGDTAIELGVLIHAMELAQKIKSKNKGQKSGKASSSKDLLSPDLRRLIFEVDNLEEQHVLSDTESDPDANSYDDINETATTTNTVPSDFSKVAYYDRRKGTNLELKPEDVTDDSEPTGFNWLSFGDLPIPLECSQGRKSHIKPQHEKLLNCPLGSFLTFLPLKLFMGFTLRKNEYAHDKMGKTG